jgi:pyridoxamine 5'-phosphate oxidase
MNPATMFGGDAGPETAVQDPLDLLDRWLARVHRTGAATTDATTTPVMALATVDGEGFPRVRHVLLSAYDRGRLRFHTDERSHKAAELAAHPRAGATIVWPEIPRQLSVSGHVTRESDAEAALAFSHRTRYLQLLAWVNDAQLARRPQAERERRWARFDADHPVLQAPPTWAGYVLVPEQITFWWGMGDSPSQRLACRRSPQAWSTERLPG